jgi:uncharacterized protein YkwD
MKMNLKYTILVCFVLLIVSCNKESVIDTEIPEAQNDVALEHELLGVVNDYRVSLGYSTLEFSAVAYEYANKHTDYMIAKGGLNHDNFTARASSISSEVNAESVAENVAKDYSTATEAFEGWLNSPAHKKTMEGDFTHTAVSVKKDSHGTFFYTQLFFK